MRENVYTLSFVLTQPMIFVMILNMDAQIAKTTQSLTSAAEMRDTTQMLMQPNANWEEYLTPAPLSIAIMGELVFISSGTDFSINKNPPPKGFQHIKYPDSFRACLMQICNSGWHAFNEAHKNMDQIRIHTATVPDYMKAAVKILFQGSDEIIETLLPDQLNNIHDIAEECEKLAEGVEKKYTDVINIIQELLEACVNAKHFHGEELKNVDMKLKETKMREKTAKELNERSKKAMETMSTQLEEAQDGFKKSMNSLPSGFEMFALGIVGGITDTMTGIVSGLTAAITGPVRTAFNSAEEVSTTSDNIKPQEEEVDMVSEMTIYSMSGEIRSIIETITQYVKEDQIEWKELYDQENKCPKTTWTEKNIQRISEDLKNMPQCKLKKKAVSLCNKGSDICRELATYQPDQKWDEKKTNQLIMTLQKLNEDAHAFDCESKAIKGSPALTPKPSMTGGITESLKGIVSGVTAVITGPVRTAFSSAEEVSTTSPNIKPQDEDVDTVSYMVIYSKSAQILSIIKTFNQYVKEGEIDWKELYDQENKCPYSTYTVSQFQRISEDLEKMPPGKLKKKVLSLCNKGIDICRELATYQPDQMWDEKKTKQLIKKVQKLNGKALKFDCKSKAITGSPALTPKPPMMFKAENSSEQQSVWQKASENARFRIEQSREQLKHTRNSYEKCVENMEKNQKELTEVLVEMQNCKINKIDFNTTLKMLVKGLDAMGRVKEQWEKMVRFFQMVSTLVKTSLSKKLDNFVTTADHTKNLSYNGKQFAKDLLYKQAFEASNIASLVHMISGTYTEVSNKYLMDRVSSLGKLMAMDKSKPEFHQERRNLQDSCQAAQDGILKLVLKNKKEFERKTDARIAQIDGELKAILPAAQPQETERIKEIVQAGFKDGGFGEDELDNFV